MTLKCQYKDCDSPVLAKEPFQVMWEDKVIYSLCFCWSHIDLFMSDHYALTGAIATGMIEDIDPQILIDLT